MSEVAKQPQLNSIPKDYAPVYLWGGLPLAIEEIVVIQKIDNPTERFALDLVTGKRYTFSDQ